jgi:hypothetical protein
VVRSPSATAANAIVGFGGDAAATDWASGIALTGVDGSTKAKIVAALALISILLFQMRGPRRDSMVIDEKLDAHILEITKTLALKVDSGACKNIRMRKRQPRPSLRVPASFIESATSPKKICPLPEIGIGGRAWKVFLAMPERFGYFPSVFCAKFCIELSMLKTKVYEHLINLKLLFPLSI